MGARWSQMKKVWIMRYQTAVVLGIRDRITEEDTSGPTHAVPDSVHLLSGLFQEGNLIAVARALEEAIDPQSGWSSHRPPLG